jgi:hypothetical protein
VTDLNTGTPSLIPLQNTITRNFLLDGIPPASGLITTTAQRITLIPRI